jgi:hypothetical protein
LTSTLKGKSPYSYAANKANNFTFSAGEKQMFEEVTKNYLDKKWIERTFKTSIWGDPYSTASDSLKNIKGCLKTVRCQQFANALQAIKEKITTMRRPEGRDLALLGILKTIQPPRL